MKKDKIIIVNINGRNVVIRPDMNKNDLKRLDVSNNVLETIKQHLKGLNENERRCDDKNFSFGKKD